jgi:hypothetical protein
MPTFDVVSKVDLHEVDNAVQQASREITTRYDFRDTQSSVERTDEGIVLRSNSEGRLEAAWGVLQEKMIRRKVALRSLNAGEPEPAGGSNYRQLIKLNQGIDTEKAKAVIKFLKQQKLKVQGSIQGDQVRVSGKKRDDLQEAIKLLREEDFGIELQFENFRD